MTTVAINLDLSNYFVIVNYHHYYNTSNTTVLVAMTTAVSIRTHLQSNQYLLLWQHAVAMRTHHLQIYDREL